MSTLLQRRKTALSRQSAYQRTQKGTFIDKLCRDIHDNKLIPIIGDTIRNQHIFDVDSNQDLGPEQIDPDGDLAKKMREIDVKKFNITEELAHFWALEGTFVKDREEPVLYPIKNEVQIARVAQFYALIHGSPTSAKVDYLTFLKTKLLMIAQEIAKSENDEEELAFIEQLWNENIFSYSDIVAELDFPRFAEGQGDPIQILARLPLKVYITTSYHDFIERELEAAGKTPHSRLCSWNNQISVDDLDFEHRPHPDYLPDENNPVVYHLLGMEQYPASMVLSEDDHLNLLWSIARDRQGDSHDGSAIIPHYFETVLKSSSLLLLGYRLHDWDLKILFRGLLREDQGYVSRDSSSIAIHIDLDEQKQLVENSDQVKAQAKKYIKSYFKQSHFDVEFGDSDEFIRKLGRSWQKWR